MFKPATFKKLIKEAWSGSGFTIGNKKGILMIEGNYWIINAKIKMMPNSMKAAIIECSGELPAEGEVFECCKGEENQQVLDFTTESDLEESWPNDTSRNVCARRVSINQNRYDVPSRVYQFKDRSITLISDIFTALINNAYVEHEKGETTVGIPVADKFGNVYWRNNIYKICAFHRNITTNEPTGLEAEDAHIVKILEMADLGQE